MLAACSWPATRDVRTADPYADGCRSTMRRNCHRQGVYCHAAPEAITCSVQTQLDSIQRAAHTVLTVTDACGCVAIVMTIQPQAICSPYLCRLS